MDMVTKKQTAFRISEGLLQRLAKEGHTVVVIDHNMDIVKIADTVIDVGLEGGTAGGNIVSTGTPEQVCDKQVGYTWQYLNEAMKS